MDRVGSQNHSIENMPQGEALGVTRFHLRQLEELTDGFSEDRLIGAGTFGKVYKGIQENGEEIAVKMITYKVGDDRFKELINHITLSHPNIVRAVGYCHDEISKDMEYNGTSVTAHEIHRALCLEYMPNGSLQRHISDECDGLDWQTRYKIIKGICEGLNYLHDGCDIPIFHLDLKPDNILLDRNMVPKLADFGVSPFGVHATHSISHPVGTIGYLPPEYIMWEVISKKFDIFSLGVIMTKIIAGRNGYSKSVEMAPNKFVDLVKCNWRKRLKATWSGSMLDGYCHQVKICAEIALQCVEEHRNLRPSADDILNRLNDMETAIDEMKVSTRS